MKYWDKNNLKARADLIIKAGNPKEHENLLNYFSRIEENPMQKACQITDAVS